ncbi:MAG: hypothetical protein QXF15_03615 [Candidatus Aenigmatarchaeota archaeon]
MTSITGISNNTQYNFIQYTTTYTIPLQPQKMYSGYILNSGVGQSNPMYATLFLIDEQNKVNQLNEIAINIFERLTFENLPLYQIIIRVVGPPHKYTYNIIGMNENKNAIPKINIEIYPYMDNNGYIYINPSTKISGNWVLYVNTGFDPTSIQGIPYNINVTVKTSPAQIQTTKNQIFYQVILLADIANTASIFIGSSTSQIYPLAAGQTLTLFYANPYNIYAYSTTAGQILHVIIMT